MTANTGPNQAAGVSKVELNRRPGNLSSGGKRAVAFGIVLAAALAEADSARPLLAQTTTTISTTTITSPTTQPVARLIEWDLPSQGGDSEPGAMVVDTRGEDQNRAWFVTRLNPNLYLLQTPNSLMKGPAQWTAWQLDAFLSGGLKKIQASHDRRFVYVRTVSTSLAAALERIDTQNCSGGFCQLTEWSGDLAEVGMDVSDVAVDDYNNVFTTHTPLDSMPSCADPTQPCPDPTQSYVQKLTPAAVSNGNATVTRWNVGGGAGLCGTGSGFDTPSAFTPCISGIAIDPHTPNLIYYSEPAANNIGQLNISTGQVQRWSLAALSLASCGSACSNPIAGPRQLQIDRRGKVWVVTGSGHLVSLDPCTNQMASHQMPDGASADPFGVAPDDDVVGYTAASPASNKVGMLLPQGQTFCITPAAAGATATTMSLSPQVSQAQVACGYVYPNPKTVMAQVTNQSDGRYIEAVISSDGNDSQNPLGVTPVKAKAQGTYFYAVGTNNGVTTDSTNCTATVPCNRVGFARLPILEKIKHPRDDDDSNDGWEGEADWHGWHGHAADDDNDDDGLQNDYDTPDQENVQGGDSAPIQGGQTMAYPMTASPTTLALIAEAQADDPLAQIGVEIDDANGILLARSGPAPGVAVVTVLLPAAGGYTSRVINYGIAPINQTPTLIVREPRVP